MAFHPYLMFGGNCREAFTLYQEVFGGELFLMAMSETPSDEPVPDDVADQIAHASLMFGDNLLMGSDDPTGFAGVSGMSVMYSTDDVAEAERVFTALADAGEVQMPFGETFWSPGFGGCVDRFGTPWMIGADAPAEA